MRKTKNRVKNEAGFGVIAELHCHSNHSVQKKIRAEGLHSVKELMLETKRKKLNVLALTDHDTIFGNVQGKKLEKEIGIKLLQGCEVSTADGHLLVYGLQEKIPKGLSFEETIDRAKEQDCFTISSHPFDIKQEGAGKKCVLADAIEVFNSLNVDRTANKIAEKFALKHNLLATVGSDAHMKEMIGLSVNKILLHENDLNEENVLKALKKGRIEIERTQYLPLMMLKDWSLERLKRSYPYTLNYINENYSGAKRFLAKNLLKTIQYSPGKIDYFYDFLTYFGFGLTYCYSKIKRR